MTDVLRIAARYKLFRYLFDDGKMLDVESPYDANSSDRELVLIEAAKRWGKRETRRIAGVATVSVPEP